MNTYKIKIDESELQLLTCLEQPITGYATDGVADGFPSSVYLSTQSQQLKFTSKSEDLEYHFECFALRICKVDERINTINDTIEWSYNSNFVELMTRRESLHSGANINDNMFGSNPSTQRVIAPEDDCLNADAICCVTAGICITHGEYRLLIYTDTFPFRMRMEKNQCQIKKILENYKLYRIDEYRKQF